MEEWLVQFTPHEIAEAIKFLGLGLAIVISLTIILKAWAKAFEAKWRR